MNDGVITCSSEKIPTLACFLLLFCSLKFQVSTVVQALQVNVVTSKYAAQRKYWYGNFWVFLCFNAVFHVISSDSTVLMGMVVLVCPTQNTVFINHPKDILYDENYLYKIILVHLASNIVFTTQKHYQAVGYWFF